MYEENGFTFAEAFVFQLFKFKTYHLTTKTFLTYPMSMLYWDGCYAQETWGTILGSFRSDVATPRFPMDENLKLTLICYVKPSYVTKSILCNTRINKEN